jgi:hypothetical protein
MFMMFDIYVWMMIAITFVGGFLIIQIVNFCSQKVKDLFFGEQIRTPTINFLAVIFGLSQKNFAAEKFCEIFVDDVHHFVLDSTDLSSKHFVSVDASRNQKTRAKGDR